MKIGLLTYADVANFGANLQALSTVEYLRRHGHEAVVIDWCPEDFSREFQRFCTLQERAHQNFFIKEIPHTRRVTTDRGIAQVIDETGIEAVIIGSDAVLQHFNRISLFHCPTSTLWRMDPITSDRRFPNAFWGSFAPLLKHPVPMAIMSASCQNTKYQNFLPRERSAMRSALERFSYISVRDGWTRRMLSHVTGGRQHSVFQGNKQAPVTPDPVFAFNANVPQSDVTLAQITRRFELPERYVLFSFKNPGNISKAWLAEIKELLAQQGLAAVALPMPSGVSFEHPFDYEISTPLDPLDWYNLIRLSEGYIGENMHPIVVCLHNAVPFFAMDAYGVRWARVIRDRRSSKVYDILRRFVLTDYYAPIHKTVKPAAIVEKLMTFPRENCARVASQMLESYNEMMRNIIDSFQQYDNKK